MPSSDSDSGASDRAASPAPAANGAGASRAGRRMSGRVRKEIQRLDPSTGKAKRKSAAHSDDDGDDDAGTSHDDATDEDDDEEFKVPTSLKTGSRKRAPRGTSPGPAPVAKRGAGAKKTPVRRAAPRKRKTAAEEDEDEAPPAAKRAQAGKDFKIEGDNGLFNAVKNPNTALQTTAEDWIESYQEESGPAMAELVNFVLRCCGCNATVDEHQAEDENGIVENLKDIVDEFKQEADLAYPLVSKSKPYKKFRGSLAQFLQKLLASCADDLLFSTSFYEHFQAWVHALSSSQIRALRHTATVVVLLCVNALSTLHVQVRKEHAQAVRAKEAEEKKSRKDKARLRDMERQVKEAHERLETVEAFMEESYTSVFVNRYRDADAVIRAECISALGSWMKLDPDYWIDGDYLRYIGWVLSDESKDARRESVRALFSLYQKDAYLGKLHHFTDRFKQQLVDMAVGEHDLSVRIQALQVVQQIDAHGLLDDDKQRDEVAMLVFEKEPRVRAAAADFFRGLVDEHVDTLKGEIDARGKTARGRKVGGRKAKEADRALGAAAQYKVLAQLLVKYGKALDGAPVGADADEDDDDSQRRSDGTDAMSVGDLVSGRAGADGDDAQEAAAVPRGRVAFAVEALWGAVESLQDWEAMLDFVLKDHSAAAGEDDSSGAKGKGRAANARGAKKGKKGAEEDDDDEEMEYANEQEGADEEQLPEEVRLTEEEETLFLEVLLASLTRVTTATATKKKDKEAEDEEHSSIGRAIIEALPKLFSKNQTIPARVVDILSLPRLVSLDLYLEGQQVSAYEALWDDVTKQLLKHTQVDVLDEAARTLVYFLAAKDLSAQNETKIAELEETLVGALRAAAGDDVEAATFGEDELHALTACVARVQKLAKVRNLSSALEDTDGGKEMSAMDILDGIVNRGRLGYKEETAMIEHALNVLGTHLVWQLQAVAVEARESGTTDLPAILAVSDRRRSLLDRLEEFAVGNETNASEGVKQVSLAFLLDLHTISRQLTSPSFDADGHLSELKLVASDELQARCAGFVEAEIERYAEALRDEADEEQDETQREGGSDDGASGSGSGSETETEARSQRAKGKGKKKAPAKKGKGKKVQPPPKKAEKRRRKTAAQIRADNAKQQAQLIVAQRFEQTLAPFVRAIHCGALDLRHGVVLLKHWGRLGPACDEQAKLLLHDLRDEGNYGSASDVVASIVVDALKGACELLLDAPEDSPSTSEEPLVSLGRNLVGVAVVRGAHLAIVDSLPAEDHLRLHLDALKWVVPKLAHLEETKRKDERNRALAFFKALAHLLLGLDGRSALKVKTSLDALLDEHGLQDAATSGKIYEPVRGYQRRLITAMSKDPSIRKAATTERAKKPAAAAKGTKAPRMKAKGKGMGKDTTFASDDEDESEPDEDQLAASEHDDDEDAAEPTQTQTQSTRGSGKRRAPPSPSQELYGTQGPPAGRAPNPSQELFGPSRSAEARAAAAAEGEGEQQQEEEEEDPVARMLRESPAPSAAASAGKKRAREDDEEEVEEEQEQEQAAEEQLGGTGDLGATQTQPDEDSEFLDAAPAPARSEREESVESAVSLSDVLKKKKRRL
ncbi:cohesin complex subunit [Rhodotorula kratochvilovae]